MAKYLAHDGAAQSAEVQTGSAGGVGDANKIPNLDSNCRLTANMMPSGFGADIESVLASETIAWLGLAVAANGLVVCETPSYVQQPYGSFPIPAVSTPASIRALITDDVRDYYGSPLLTVVFLFDSTGIL